MTKLRRPTIPLAEWRIATSLIETQQVQRKLTGPAVGCDCEDCVYWRGVAKQAVPAGIARQLLRFGVNLTQPTDVYVCSVANETLTYRVIYHTVGRILSGPQSWDFLEIHKGPHVSIRVLRADQTYEHTPKPKGGEDRDVICIDMKVDINDQKAWARAWDKRQRYEESQ